MTSAPFRSLPRDAVAILGSAPLITASRRRLRLNGKRSDQLLELGQSRSVRDHLTDTLTSLGQKETFEAAMTHAWDNPAIRERMATGNPLEVHPRNRNERSRGTVFKRVAL